MRVYGRVSLLGLVLLVGMTRPASALNKQGARSEDHERAKGSPFDLSGYLFGGVFVFNPSYAARPNNTGLALLRYGLHVDADLYHRWLSVSYDLNVFTDKTDGARSPLAPTEHDHIVGLLSTISLPRSLELTLAVHYETDRPGYEAVGPSHGLHPTCSPSLPLSPPDCYLLGYSQAYVDAYARLTWTHGRWLVAGALGGFLWNPSYAARPDNSGLALLRYVLHGEVTALPWLIIRLDLNFFTDRQELYVVPSELDLTSEIALRLHAFELRFVGELDQALLPYSGGPNPPFPYPGFRQVYLAVLGQWSFDFANLRSGR